MEKIDIFDNISPLDHRYRLSNPELFESLSGYLSEESGARYCVRVEVALIESHLEERGQLERFRALLKELPQKVLPEEIQREEESTHHYIRAVVNVIKSKLPEEIRHLVHLGATSVDILDTATAIRYRDVVREVILPLMIELEEHLITLATDHADTPQVGRTHGQHAVPITFGFAMAEYVSRFGKCITEVERRSNELRGKLAGGVGASNGIALIYDDPKGFERGFLRRLVLSPSEHSTQLVEPEYLLRLLLELNIAFGVIANLADDLRNLQRSEIGEVREGFSSSQVGSSTMPQKRNPWNSEHVKSLWKVFSPRVATFFADQISEHQRDLTNSATSRFIPEYIAGFASAVSRISKVVGSLEVCQDRMKLNLEGDGDLVLAEAAYIIISSQGDSEGHEKLRQLTLKCEKEGGNLGVELRKDARIWEMLDRQLQSTSGSSAEEFFSNPSSYSGVARSETMHRARSYSAMIEQTRNCKLGKG